MFHVRGQLRAASATRRRGDTTTLRVLFLAFINFPYLEQRLYARLLWRLLFRITMRVKCAI